MTKSMSEVTRSHSSCNGNGSTRRREAKVENMGRGERCRARVEVTEKPRGTWKQFMRSDQQGAVIIRTHILSSFSQPPLLYPFLSPSISS